MRALGLLLAAVPAAAACRARTAPTTIRIAHESDAMSLDPAAVQEAATHSILSNVCESLVAFDRDMILRPALALTWTTPDENTWLIQLRKGVRFHDGRPLTAADVKYTLDRARKDPASAIKGLLASVEEVEVLDPGTLRLRTRTVEPLLMTRLSYVLVVPEPGPHYDASRLVGTGPYKLVGWRKGFVLEAQAFDAYWGGRPPIDRVQFVPVEEGAGSVAALRQGLVDVLRFLPENMADALRSVPGVRLRARPGLATYYLWMNTQQAPGAPRNPFADRRVRRAISLAIDRKGIVAELKGHATPADQLVQPGVFGYASDLGEPGPDLEASRRLLREAGYAGGFDTTLVHRPQASLTVVAGLVRGTLAEVGVRVTVEAPAWSEILAGWDAARLPFFLAAWRFEDGDATGFLTECLFTKDPARHRGMNNPGYSNPELDRMIEENSRMLGEAKRLQHYRKLMAFAMQEMPVVPLYHKHNLYGVSTNVAWEPRLDGKLLAAEMSLDQESR